MGGQRRAVARTSAPARWWMVSEEYLASLARYGRPDAWLAVAVVAVACVVSALQGQYDATHEYAGEAAELRSGFAELTVWLVLLGVLLALRRQDARHLGFSRTRLPQSLLAGAAFAAVIIAATAALGLILNGYVQRPEAYWFTWGVPYYLIVIGFTEELIFRGFVTPRLAAQFSRQWIGVALAGVLFAISHIPYRLVQSGTGLGEFLAADWPVLVIPFLWHWVLWWLYARWNSLAAPTLTHWAMNWAGLLL